MDISAVELVNKYPSVYWDVSAEGICEKKHISFLIERMLEHGTLAGIHDLFTVFSRSQIEKVVTHSRRISRKTALFWKNYLGIKETIRCLEKEYQNPLSKLWE